MASESKKPQVEKTEEDSAVMEDVIPPFDFTDSNDPRFDVALLIGGEKVYANKDLLAARSFPLMEMFYDWSVHPNQKVFELKNYNPKEFIEMLKFIYPSNAKITDENVMYLLKLGHCLQIKVVIDKVEEFLIASPNFTIPAKIRLAYLNFLGKLQDYALGTFKTVQEALEFKNTPEYKGLPFMCKDAFEESVKKLH